MHIWDREDLTFVDDSEEVQRIKDDCCIEEDYDSFFVNIEDGEYSEIYGMFGIVPTRFKLLDVIAPKH